MSDIQPATAIEISLLMKQVAKQFEYFEDYCKLLQRQINEQNIFYNNLIHELVSRGMINLDEEMQGIINNDN